MSLIITRLSTPTKSGVTPTSVAADITKYGGLAVAILEVVENTIPGVGVPGGAQAIIAAVVAVLTGVLSVLKQQDVASAKAGK